MKTSAVDLSQAGPLPEDLAAALREAQPERGAFGSAIYYFPTAGSTNDIAARLAEAGAPEGTTVIADAQTGGRGRLGRTWFSPPGTGLYVSVVARLDAAGGRAAPVPLPARLTLLAGVALAEAVREVTGLEAEIKWPNDLVFHGRKLAGILTEGAARRDAIEHVIIGIGINVGAAAFPPDIAHRAGSLEGELGRPVDRGPLLARLLAHVARACQAARHDDMSGWFDRWRGLSPSSHGSPVEWRAPDGIRRGTTAGLDDDGALLVDTDRGRERVLAGEVLWVQARR